MDEFDLLQFALGVKPEGDRGAAFVDVHEGEFLDIPCFLDLVVDVDEVARREGEGRDLFFCGGCWGDFCLVCGRGRVFLFVGFCGQSDQRQAEEEQKRQGRGGSL